MSTRLAAKSAITMEWEIITPEIARTWLDQNRNLFTNRPVTQHGVMSLAADMRNGQWITTTTPVKFNVRGHLIDGQHRLHALVESGKTFQFLVVRGCPEDEFSVQDIGRKRSIADLEFIRCGGSVPAQLLKTRMAVMTHMSSSYAGVPKKFRTQPAKIAFYDLHQDAIVWAVDTAEPRHTKQNLPHSTVVLAVLARASYHHDRTKLEQFSQLFRHGNTEDAESPVLRLRDYVLGAPSKAGRAFTTSLYRLTETALLAFLQHRSVKSLRPVSREIFPLPEEQVPIQGAVAHP